MKVIYIDTQNIHKGIESLGRTIDWGVFYQYLNKKFQPTHIKMFMGYLPQLQHLYKKMNDIGYIVVLKQTARRIDGTIKGNVDIDLTMHVMEDLLVGGLVLGYIVSGDGDYNTLVGRLSKEGKLGRLIVPTLDKTTSQLRHSAGSNIQAISDLRHLLSKKETSSEG